MGPSTRSRAAVFGAGPVGLATASHLARRGMAVTLCDASPKAIEPLQRDRQIRLDGLWEGAVAIDLATTDAAEAARGAELIVSAVPASSHSSLGRALSGVLAPGAIVLLQPGATLSAVAFLNAAGLDESSGVTVVETLNTLFTGRLRRPGHVTVMAQKRSVPYAALPASRGAEAGARLESLFPALTPAGSILEVSLHNVNAVMHPVVTLLNAGPIDGGREFLFYVEGGSPKVMGLVEAVDRERLAILEALGLPRFSVLEWYDRAYGARGPDLYQLIQGLSPYSTIQAPSSLETRLLLEDVPTGLVPYCSIAEAVGVSVPLMRSLVELAGALYGRDFWREGRTLDRLGLGSLDREGLLTALGPRGGLARAAEDDRS